MRPTLFLAVLACAVAASCSEKWGNEGEHCLCEDCGIVSANWSCNAELVCNTAPSLIVCQKPHIVALGGDCGRDVNCEQGLICRQLRCRARLGDGEPCSGPPEECLDGLECAKRCDPVATCRPIGHECTADGGVDGAD